MHESCVCSCKWFCIIDDGLCPTGATSTPVHYQLVCAVMFITGIGIDTVVVFIARSKRRSTESSKTCFAKFQNYGRLTCRSWQGCGSVLLLCWKRCLSGDQDQGVNEFWPRDVHQSLRGCDLSAGTLKAKSQRQRCTKGMNHARCRR